MLEKMKAAFSRLGVIAANYLPVGFKDVMLDMAKQSDEQKAEIKAINEQLAVLHGLLNTNH